MPTKVRPQSRTPRSVEKTDVRGFLRRRFSRTGYLGLRLTVGLILLVVACWAFAEITEDVVTGDSTLQVDDSVANYLHEHGTPGMTHVMFACSFIGSTKFLAPMTVLLGAFLAWRRRWHHLLMLSLVVPGGVLLNMLVKHVVHRHRPVFENPIATLDSFSFPSGHTMGATLFYGLVTVFIFMTRIPWSRKITALVIAGLIVALVAFSRIYLGLHYLSDVLGAAAAGAAWLLLCVTGVEIFRGRKLAEEARRN